MPEYLQRDQAPLASGQWAALDRAAVQTAQAELVARRFMALVGPFGAGVEAVATDTLAGGTSGRVDLLGNNEGHAIDVERRRFMPLPVVYKDFWLHWRDLEASQQLGLPLDISKAAGAASACARAEDQLIFDGEPSLGIPGLRTVDDRLKRTLGDWGSGGQAFADVVEGVRLLTAAGFSGPYALVVSPQLYAQLHRIFDNSGVLEVEQVEKLARRGVFPSSVLPEPAALLADSSTQNMDIALALDLAVAFVESTNLNYRFRVLESLAPRIHRPKAICTFDAA